MEDTAKVRIRMYRQGLGDCFLLTFFTGEKENRKEVHMLIDCGSVGKGNGISMETAVRDIYATTGGHIDILVVTHEHEDHVSGFNVSGTKEIEKEEGKKVKLRLFEELFPRAENNDRAGIDNVWMAWTESVEEKVKEEPGKDGKTKKVTNIDLRTASRKVFPMLSLAQEDLEKKALEGNAELRDLYGIEDLLHLLDFEGSKLAMDEDQTFIGDDLAYTIDRAMDTARNIGKGVKLLFPGDVEEPELIPGWRFYVLGPPQDKNQLQKLDDSEEKEKDDKDKGKKKDTPQLYHFAKGQFSDLSAVIQFFLSKKSLRDYRREVLIDSEERQRFNACFPFDDRFRKEVGDAEGSKEAVGNDTYGRYFKGQAWRRIDYDWLLGPAESLALQLDNYTNNTSLVLAMEHKDGRVLLFPGDAQLGNWQTWHGSLGELAGEVITFRVDKETGKLLDLDKEEFEDQKRKGELRNSVDLLKRTVFYKVGHHSSHNATTKAGLEQMNAEGRGLVAMISLNSETAANKGKSGWNMPAPGLYEALLNKAHVLRSDTGWPSADEDKKEKPTKWYNRNFGQADSGKQNDTEKKDKPDWENIKTKIESYRSRVLSKASIKSLEAKIYIQGENGEPRLETRKFKGCVYEDPDKEFRIEYEVDKELPDSAGKPPPKLPDPTGNYIDYYMY